MIQDSASSAALCAILAARERATGGRSNRDGADGSLVAYASTQAHSSVEKGVRIAGLGSDNLRLIEVDDHYAMRPDRLAEAIAADRAAGRSPCFVCATVGTTSSTAVDPLPEIGRICREHGLWLHVDAALAGTAALCPEFRYLHDGLELADSYCFNPHKWMFTNFDCDCFFVADRAQLIRALSILPEYLRNQATRVRGGDRLSRLAGPAGPAVPRPEAVVRDPLVRGRRIAGARSPARGLGPGVCRLGAE